MLQMMVQQAEAFTNDCSALLAEFVASRSPQFNDFCSVWKRMNFQYIFYGHSSDEHLVQFTETAVNIVKKIFVNSTSALEQIGSFYLIYAFYFKQPTRQFCKLRLTMDEASVLLQFYDNLPADYDQVRLCYWKLVQADAFRFVECEHEFGFERWLNREGMQEVAIHGKSARIGNDLVNQIGTLKEGIIPAMQMLEAGYNEMKEHLDTSLSRNLLPATSIMTEVNVGIRNIEKLFLISKPLSDDQKDKKKLLQSDQAVLECVDDLEMRCEAQDLPNIGERRSLLKKRGQAMKWSALEDTTPSQPTTVDSPKASKASNDSMKRKRKSKKEMAILRNQTMDEEALNVTAQEMQLENERTSSQ